MLLRASKRTSLCTNSKNCWRFLVSKSSGHSRENCKIPSCFRLASSQTQRNPMRVTPSSAFCVNRTQEPPSKPSVCSLQLGSRRVAGEQSPLMRLISHKGRGFHSRCTWLECGSDSGSFQASSTSITVEVVYGGQQRFGC